MLDKQKIREDVSSVIISVMDNDTLNIQGDSSLINDLGMDSVDFASLIMALEDEFGGVIEEHMLENITTVDGIIELICSQKLAEPSDNT